MSRIRATKTDLDAGYRRVFSVEGNGGKRDLFADVDGNVAGKYLQPDWSPPAAIRRDRPSIPDVIPGGSPNNPMGAAAMTLTRGQYAIHGTNSPGSIGGYVSYGCIRMFNHDIMDLYQRVSIGTSVVVLR